MGVQSFIDSTTGTVIGTTLHTIGAIAMLAAVVAYISWSRQARIGDRAVGLLQTSAVLGYLAIVTNLVGGFMRTYQSDHPDIALVAENRWVQVLLVKHVFLFAGMVALVALFEVLAPRVLRALKDGRTPAWSGHTPALVLAVGAIVVASVLGALAQVTPLGLEDMPEPEPEPPFEGRSYHFEGQLTGDPLTGGQASGVFDIAAGADGAQAVLDWSPPVFDLVLVLQPPDGEATAFTGADGRVDVILQDPAPGTWTYTVRSDVAAGATWTLDVLVRGETTVIEENVTIAPGAFYEINTEMQEGASFAWEWTAGAVVHFDVHSHFDGEVQYHVEEDARQGEGNFTNDRAGGYSLLWANEGTAPVQVDLRVEGVFDLHSIHQ